MGSAKSGRRRLTDEQRDEIFHRMMKTSNGKESLAKRLAAEFSVSEHTIWRVYGSEEVLNRAKMKAERSRLENLLRVQQLASKAIDVQEDLMTREVNENLLYINQNAARDLLDRAGVRAKDQTEVEQKIVFETGNIDFGFSEDGDGTKLQSDT